MGQLPAAGDGAANVRNHGPSEQIAVEPYDWAYCRYLAEQHGVMGIPASPFFSRSDYSAHYGLPSLARFAFCKRDETLHEAARRLADKPHNYTAERDKK